MSDNTTPQTSHKKRTYASNATIALLATIGIVVGVNVVSTRVFGRWDLTRSKIYTLSDASKELMRSLPDYVTLKAYISSDLPPELASTSRYVRDLLDEYSTSSKNGKLRFIAADPGKDKTIADEAAACGVRPLQIQKLETSKIEVGSYYMGICVEYNGKQEAIPQVVNQESIEYQVTSVIKRMTQRKRKIAFTSGHGELELQGVQHFLSQEFETTTVNPSQSAIGDDVDALVVAGPRQALDDKARHEIDGFLMKGKGAIILADGMVVSAPDMHGMGMAGINLPKSGHPNNHGLNEILKAYGFSIDADLIMDRRNVPGPIEVQGQRFVANAPMFAGVQLPSYDDRSFTVLEGLKGAVFPYASSVQLVGPLEGGKPSQGKLWKVAETSPKSWKVTQTFTFNPEEELKETADKGPFALGYAYQGKVKSAFAPAASNMSAPDANAPASESKKDVRLVVIGDSDFVSDEFLEMSRFLPIYRASAELFVNGISWVVEDETLTPIRAKNVTARPISIESEGAAQAAKVINIAGVPLAFCLFGVLRWRLRKSRRQGQTL
jgi:gliding-associated putative ABC transporter substrate-binding component GldG